MEKLTKPITESFDNVLTTLVENCVQPDVVKKLGKDILNQKLKTAECKEIHDSVIKNFKDECKDGLKKILNDFEIDKKLQERQDLIEDQENRKDDEGWRPTGDFETDFYGDRRPVDLKYAKKFQELRDDMERELRRKKQEYEELRRTVDEKLKLLKNN